ncbi:hypothetical protein L3Q82_012494 [Scortum barcoo]|uniref:Uncharacterized protein n=1 Tax=Scortum barcoo TaxID=214431 RepID=A0ACB8W3E4_9TELE|nr:hypothetical protein L3Q82_012494 [Scortum barcoo]
MARCLLFESCDRCLGEWVEESPTVQKRFPPPPSCTLTFQQVLRTHRTHSSSSISASWLPLDHSKDTMAVIRNEIFSCFVFYGVLLVIKMYIIAVITGQVRLRKKAFANPEDALRHGGLQYHRDDPYVERCRRAHWNDLENIIPFLFLGAIYSMTGPSLTVARLHFVVFFLGRVVHTIAYLFALQAPTRSLAYTVAQIPCVSMAVQILMAVTTYA